MNTLLLKGASTKLRDKEGRQAVHFAAASGNEQILKMILDKDTFALNSQIRIGTVDRTDNDSLDSWSHDHESVAAKVKIILFYVVCYFIFVYCLYSEKHTTCRSNIKISLSNYLTRNY